MKIKLLGIALVLALQVPLFAGDREARRQLMLDAIARREAAARPEQAVVAPVAPVPAPAPAPALVVPVRDVVEIADEEDAAPVVQPRRNPRRKQAEDKPVPAVKPKENKKRTRKSDKPEPVAAPAPAPAVVGDADEVRVVAQPTASSKKKAKNDRPLSQRDQRAIAAALVDLDDAQVAASLFNDSDEALARSLAAQEYGDDLGVGAAEGATAAVDPRRARLNADMLFAAQLAEEGDDDDAPRGREDVVVGVSTIADGFDADFIRNAHTYGRITLIDATIEFLSRPVICSFFESHRHFNVVIHFDDRTQAELVELRADGGNNAVLTMYPQWVRQYGVAGRLNPGEDGADWIGADGHDSDLEDGDAV